MTTFPDGSKRSIDEIVSGYEQVSWLDMRDTSHSLLRSLPDRTRDKLLSWTKKTAGPGEFHEPADLVYCLLIHIGKIDSVSPRAVAAAIINAARAGEKVEGALLLA